MSVERRRQKIDADHPDLPVGRQCALISLSRPAFYYRPRGESAFNLDLMRQIDAAFTRPRFTQVLKDAKVRITWTDAAAGWTTSSSSACGGR